MKLSRSRIALLALLCGSSLAQADILILKNGTKHEGTILNESADSVRMRYRLTPKIWDEKDFPMSEIQQVVKQTPQEVELIELKKLLPTPDLMTPDKYEQLIQDRVRPFINKYSGTPEAKEAEEIVNTLQEEKKRVSNGEAKLDGRWMSANETKGEQYNIAARKLHEQMKQEMAQSNWLEALIIFDKFQRNRPPLTASSYYPEVIADALTCMEKLDITYSKMTDEQPTISKQRDENLKKLNDADRARTKAAIDAEKTKWRAQMDAQRRANVRWIEPYKYDLPSIQNAQKTLVAEKTRLESINMDDLKARNEAIVAVYRKIGEGDYTGGAAAYERVQGLGSVQEYRDVIADLKGQLLKLYGELVRKNQSAQGAVAGSSAIGGTPAANNVDDRVARILAGNNPAGTPAPTANTQAPAAVPNAAAPGAAPAAAAPAVPAAQQQRPATAPAPQQAAPVQAPAPAPYPPQAAAMPVQEESSIQTYIIIGLVVVLGLVSFLAFKKKKAE